MNKQNSGAALKENMSALKRTVKMLFEFYPRLAPLTVAFILFSSIVSAVPSLFVQNVLAVIEKWYQTGDWASARPEVLHYLIILAVLYLLSLLSALVYPQLWLI